jgi:hypothetical protein
MGKSNKEKLGRRWEFLAESAKTDGMATDGEGVMK